jgi:hypothetical protein
MDDTTTKPIRYTQMGSKLKCETCGVVFGLRETHTCMGKMAPPVAIPDGAAIRTIDVLFATTARVSELEKEVARLRGVVARYRGTLEVLRLSGRNNVAPDLMVLVEKALTETEHAS